MEREFATISRAHHVSYCLRRTVTATASTADKLDWLLSLPAGATHAANYKKESFVEVTNAATGGKGVDLIVDMVGQAHFSRNLEALATDGRMTMLSLISGSPNLTRLSVVLIRGLKAPK